VSESIYYLLCGVVTQKQRWAKLITPLPSLIFQIAVQITLTILAQIQVTHYIPGHGAGQEVPTEIEDIKRELAEASQFRDCTKKELVVTLGELWGRSRRPRGRWTKTGKTNWKEGREG
jgi:hypothetical protein